MVRTTTGRDAVRVSDLESFELLGNHGTTMRDIAHGAGLTVASIYSHFSSKQQMLQDIMVRVLSDALALTRSAVLRAGPGPHDQLSALMHAWLLFHTELRAEALRPGVLCGGDTTDALGAVLLAQESQGGVDRALTGPELQRAGFEVAAVDVRVRALLLDDEDVLPQAEDLVQRHDVEVACRGVEDRDHVRPFLRVPPETGCGPAGFGVQCRSTTLRAQPRSGG